MQFAGNDIWTICLRWIRLLKHEFTKHSNWDIWKISLHILYYQCIWNTKEVKLILLHVDNIFCTWKVLVSLFVQCKMPAFKYRCYLCHWKMWQFVRDVNLWTYINISIFYIVIRSLKGAKHPQALLK